mgnify:CR=1 FL=1
MIRRPPRSTLDRSSAASDVYKRQAAYGVAVASKFIAVGAVVPAAVGDVGAVATQSFAKVSYKACLLYTSPSPRDRTRSRMPSSA